MDADHTAQPTVEKHATLVLPPGEDCCGSDGHSHGHHHHHHNEDDGALSNDEDGNGGAGTHEEEDDADDPAHRIVVPSDVTTISADSESIEWVGTVGQKITILDGLQVCSSKLKSLNLRSNLLRRMLGVRHCKDSLTYLELYDNRIEALEDLDELTNLEVLDISYNRIRDLVGITATGSSAAQPVPSGGVIGCLRNLSNLRELFIASNKITSSWGLQNCTKLTRLDLGNNKIRKIEGLESLVNLKELWLGKNKIKKVEGLDTLVALEKLDIQSNRLESIGDGLKALVNLKELYLGHNGLKKVLPEEVDHLNKLTTLDLTGNVIENLEGSGIDRLTSLTDLWVSVLCGTVTMDFPLVVVLRMR
jgi:protein phosphatase 1 regulatory subunit 7